jgi:glutaminyl-peptide cyclotransferase
VAALLSYRWSVGFLACLASIACSDVGRPRRAGPEFNGARAFADLRDLVGIGPRPAGSPGAAATRELIRTRLRQAGWTVEDHVFTVSSPSGEPVEMVNLIASLAGAEQDSIVLGTHYDTKRFDRRFLGANDGASGVAVLLELARLLGVSRPRLTLRLAFFDGEEAFGPTINNVDGLYGSRALADKWLQEGELDKIRALLLVDMVGDRDLNLCLDQYSAPNLRALLLEEGEGIVDPKQSLYLVDDHIPFRERGLDQVLLLLDFQYGSRETPGPLWHTPGDDLPAVSAESLQRVGDLVVRLLGRLGAEPDAPASPRGRSAAPAAGLYSQAPGGSARGVGDFGPDLALRSGCAPGGGLRGPEHCSEAGPC